MTAYTRTFDIPWHRPPLTSNQRMHWAHKAKITKEVRNVAFMLARDVPFLACIEVTLTWVVTSNRRRDEDNIVPTLKALCDGLVDADIVPDDTPEFMRKHMPRIRLEPGNTAHFELTITELPEGNN